jgi:hypothetical protein
MDTAQLEVIDISDAKLELMPRANGIEKFQPLLAKLPEAEARIASLAIVDEDAPKDIARKSAEAKRLRLDAFRAARVEAGKIHKELKAGVLEIGKQLDGVERELRQRCEKSEALLEAIETHAARMEQQRRADLRSKRAELISPFLTGPMAVDLADLSDEDFASQLNDAKELAELRAERERVRLAEEERQRAEAEEKRKQEEAEREKERLRLEQERKELAAKLEEERKQAAAEREKLEAEQKAERERMAKEVAEAHSKAEQAERKMRAQRDAAAAEQKKRDAEAAETKAKEDAENAAKAKAEQERLAEERRAASAPDAAKVKGIIDNLSAINPQLASKKASVAVVNAIGLAITELERIRTKLQEVGG